MGDMQDKEPLRPGEAKPINSVVSPGRSVSSSGSQDFGYEELSNGLTCPTCQGTGKIPRGQEDDLVALIPYRDERLKPRRTTLYVCLSVFICMATAGVLCAFFIPRPISFVEDHADTVYAEISNKTNGKALDLTLMNYFNVTNKNFVSLQITNITMQVISTFKVHVVNDASKIGVIGKTIPLRTNSGQFTYAVNVTIHDKDDFPLTTIYYKFMLQDGQSSLTHYQNVNCKVHPRPYDKLHVDTRSGQINTFNSNLGHLRR